VTTVQVKDPASPGSSRLLGVLGGMGPLASAEFLATLYRTHRFAREQQAPRCILLSDPAIPDRTDEILRDSRGPLIAAIAAALERLLAAGASRLLIACVTAHAVLAELPETLRERIISLIDLTLAACAAAPRRRLLLVSSGSRAARIFESHPAWPGLASSIILPSGEEQEELHRWIYELKSGGDPAAGLDWLARIEKRHQTAETIFGCTELHLLHRAARSAGLAPLAAVDPLCIAARDLERLLAPG
jgi:aspartate racemase